MSENPFRDDLQDNPYVTPSATSDNMSGNPLLLPGIALAILSGAFLLLLVMSTPSQLIRMSEADIRTPEGAGELTGGILALVGWFASTLAIFLGSIAMIRLRGYGIALTAAILSSVPICSPCFFLGIPFGIWALIAMRRPDVKSRLRS